MKVKLAATVNFREFPRPMTAGSGEVPVARRVRPLAEARGADIRAERAVGSRVFSEGKAGASERLRDACGAESERLGGEALPYRGQSGGGWGSREAYSCATEARSTSVGSTRSCMKCSSLGCWIRQSN